MANQDPLLSFEEFIERQNKFYLHFVGEPGTCGMSNLYRDRDPYKQCMRAHPEQFEKLRAELQAMHDDSNTLFFGPTYRHKLYDAYQMMHPYAEKNCDLFR